MTATRLTRREAIRMLEAAGLGVMASLADGDLAAAAIEGAAQQAVAFQQGAIIRTVLKDVAPESLGVVAFHEHLHMSSSFGIRGGPGAPQPDTHFSEDFDLMVEELRRAARDGVTCILDAGHADQGRRVPYVRQLSKHSGVPVVVSGGYHSEASYPPEVRRMSEDDLVDELVRNAAAERWGAFGEIGVWADFTLIEKKVARAVSRAHVRTRLPVFTHTPNGQWALEQLELYTSMGVDPGYLAIGHLANLVDDPSAAVHKAVAQAGAYVGLDRVGREPELDVKVIPIVRSLIDAGYVDNILFGSDGGAFDDILEKNGGPGYGRSITVFLPKLRAAGVSEEHLYRITVDNPRRFLAFVPKQENCGCG